ncbi:Hypothetical predicted protein [Cloeon dipterum]|uniref:Uncharacterized protein n=1 Tax=Cloeon dipterum TaxID=197152 RepID=A0A8S1DA65_9INSE|nr:Hypothetical predicted protein [Cloeon dipterum]
MEAERKCTEAGCTGKKECGDYCIVCFILNEDPIEDSPRPDEGNFEKTGDQLAKNETLAASLLQVDIQAISGRGMRIPIQWRRGKTQEPMKGKQMRVRMEKDVLMASARCAMTGNMATFMNT